TEQFWNPLYKHHMEYGQEDRFLKRACSIVSYAYWPCLFHVKNTALFSYSRLPEQMPTSFLFQQYWFPYSRTNEPSPRSSMGAVAPKRPLTSADPLHSRPHLEWEYMGDEYKFLYLTTHALRFLVIALFASELYHESSQRLNVR